MEKKVSFIMPIYNAEKYVQQAIESVLNQTYKNFELILVDDISTDSTMECLKKYKDERIRILHNDKNAGIAYSRNRGMDAATGEYIALMDDDDISMPERLEKQVMFLEEHPEIDFVGGKYQLIDKNGNILYEEKKAYKNPLYIKALFLFQNIYSNGEMMFRKDTIDRNQIRYAENQYGMEDFKFWIECSKIGKFSTIDEVFLQHRVHEQSETVRNKMNMLRERERHRMELQRYSMILSGFSISEEELVIINQYTNNAICRSKSEFRKYFKALKSIINQAQDAQLDFYEEIDILCRKYVIYQIRHVIDLWEE